MVSTRSQSKSMSITSEMRDYFENLMKPLVTNDKLEQLLKSFHNGLMKKIEDKFNEQNTRIEELESKLAIKQNIIDNLEIKCDDNEQYSRRSCFRVHGLDFSSDEDEGVMKKWENVVVIWVSSLIKMKLIVSIILANIIWTRRKIKK